MSDEFADTAQTLAARDVELDWYKVTGYRAVIYANSSWHPPSQLPSNSPVVFFGDAQRHDWLGTTFNLSARGCGLERGPESHCILRVDSFIWGGACIEAPAVVAVGNGTRGAIFAAYAFSELVLGVSPFYKFTFDQPLWTGRSLAVGPGLLKAYGPPQFRHRAIFLNDEELLGFFRRDPLGEQIFDPATVDAILETLLRAKGNAIIMGTTPYPDERSLKLAARRGVVLTASHFEIVGFNAFAWSRAFGKQARELWDWSKHPDLMGHVWNATIHAQKDYEMIWSVGLRGLNDYAYPNCIKDDDGPMGCGAIISDAIANQCQLLKKATGKSLQQLDFKFNLWTEALPLYERGLLKLPNQTALVMSDSGAGYIHGNDATYAAADGVYYHVQMLNGNGGQITEFVPPSRIFEQLSSFIRRARSTSIFVLNLSDLKPAVLSASAALSMVWDPTPFMVNSSHPGVPNRTSNESQALFLAAWAKQNFRGADQASLTQVATLWTQYFQLPWVERGASDEMLGGQIGGIASSLAADLDRNFSVTAKTLVEAQAGVKLAESGLDAAVVLHEAAVSLLPQLPPQRQQFLRSHLLLQAAIQRYAVTAISHLANATVTLAAAGSPATSASAQVALADVAAALAAIDALFQAERAAEGSGEWRGLYWADRHRFTNFQARRRTVLAMQAALQRLPYAPATQIDCCQMEYSYQWTPQHTASYPLFYDDASARASDFVMISCANATADGGVCENAMEGGRFVRSAEVTLTIPVVSGATPPSPDVRIMYSTDGKEPSTVYSQPIVLSKTTTIKAVMVAGGVPAVQSRQVLFTRTQ